MYESPPDSPGPDLNKAFIDQSPGQDSPLSVCTMSPASRSQLNHDLQDSSVESEVPSLVWDNDPSAVNLTNSMSMEVQIPDSDVSYCPNLDSLDSSELEDDSVFDLSWRSSTPARITRSMTSSGEYEANFSPIPFIRNSQLRRPLVRWQPQIPQIADRIPVTQSADSPTHRRRRRPAPALSSSSN